MTQTSHTSVAVVTGAARGIGLATTRWFLNQGYRVVLIDNDATTLAQTSATLKQEVGDALLAIACDVSNEQQVLAAATQVDKTFGRVDALVNNAGIAVFKPIAQTSLQEWQSVMAVNLDGPFIFASLFAPDAAHRWWQHCQYRFYFRFARQYFACGLRHQQSRCHSFDQTTSG